jgi:hypothetical protein
VETGTLAIDPLIDGFPCKAHKEVEFFRAGGLAPENGRPPMASLGKLKRCTPSVDSEFAGNSYLAGPEVTLNAYDGVALGVLAADQDVDGHWCKHGTEVERPNQRAVRFTLARDETISAIAPRAASLPPSWLTTSRSAISPVAAARTLLSHMTPDRIRSTLASSAARSLFWVCHGPPVPGWRVCR